MNYECLRNCYIGERLWKEGKVYELPADIEKHPKNFRPVGQAPELEVPQSIPEPREKETKPVRPGTILSGQYWCSKCSRLHREKGKIGRNHLKHKKQEVSNGSS